MEESKKTERPYKSLGNYLKNRRVNQCESIAEVSGAVEIDAEILAAIEMGVDRPDKEILLLLISHFEIDESEARRLWNMAGYTQSDPDDDERTADIPASLPLTQAFVIMPADDRRIDYSDGFNIAVNSKGAVISFSQALGGREMPVARVGMSLEQAHLLLNNLYRQLHHPDKKTLPAPKRDQANQ